MTKSAQVLARYRQIIEEEPMPRQYGHPGMGGSQPPTPASKSIVSTVKDAVSDVGSSLSNTLDTLKRANPVKRFNDTISKALK